MSLQPGQVAVKRSSCQEAINAAAYAAVAMSMQIAVVGGSEASPDVLANAEATGRGLASAGATLVCGGLGGVMAAACRGAKLAGGLTIGILPGTDRSAANRWVDVVIATGLGEARNSLVVSSSSAVIAIDGEYGTLSEIALALRADIPVIGLGTWSLTHPNGAADDGIVRAPNPIDAVATAIELASSGRG
jgi:uncharacterized protein (TIGR00725 family)